MFEESTKKITENLGAINNTVSQVTEDAEWQALSHVPFGRYIWYSKKIAEWVYYYCYILKNWHKPPTFSEQLTNEVLETAKKIDELSEAGVKTLSETSEAVTTAVEVSAQLVSNNIDKTVSKISTITVQGTEVLTNNLPSIPTTVKNLSEMGDQLAANTGYEILSSNITVPTIETIGSVQNNIAGAVKFVPTLL